MEYFQSRDTRYKSIFGAVMEGQSVRFAVCIPRSEGCAAARFLVRREGEAELSQGMFWAGMEGDSQEWWDVTFTPPAEGLYWYRFELDTSQGVKQLSLAGEGRGELSRQSVPWQLTVYEKDMSVPGWLEGGVLYQIFPDRFHRSKRPKQNVPSGRILRDDWGGQPEFRPNARGKILNNDYFGGDLAGITEKLPYLQSLGVTCLYLNPIFEAHSNHRYDTADYSKIDPLLGTEEDFRELCRQAKERGISILLDGVFSHTGADSIYFNLNRRYPVQGAYNSTESPYFRWFTFQHWPDRYSSWWGIDILPEVDESQSDFQSYICGENGILRKWLRAGARGWRLDVADELPDDFLDALRRAVKEENPEALILGEVWEDATTKISHGGRRRFLRGRQLDTVMNYPFRSAILDFLQHQNARNFTNSVMSVLENYPPMVIHSLMNHIGTHDTERAVTYLSGEPAGGCDRNWQACQTLSDSQREEGFRRLKLAGLLQYILPGVPCLYYGDEAGMEGYRDPFNRGCFPWGRENADLLSFYRTLGQVRQQCDCLKRGEIRFLPAPDGVVALEREGEKDRLLCVVNSNAHAVSFTPPDVWNEETCLSLEEAGQAVTLQPLSGMLVWRTACGEVSCMDVGNV